MNIGFERTNYPDGELIDTLWNVNSISISLNFWISGINRYIMECKCYPAGHF